MVAGLNVQTLRNKHSTLSSSTMTKNKAKEENTPND